MNLLKFLIGSVGILLLLLFIGGSFFILMLASLVAESMGSALAIYLIAPIPYIIALVMIWYGFFR